MKKTLAIILTALVLVSLFASCGPAQTGTSDSPAAPSESASASASASASNPAPAGDVTLTVALNMDVQEAFEAFMKDFESKNPGVKIDLVAIPPAIADYVQPAIASNTMPDALSVNSDSFCKQLADEGWLMDLNGTACRNLVSDTVVDFFTSGSGKFYGLPYGVATILIYYNADMFAEFGIANVPTDWDSFVNVCETIKGHGVAPLSVAISDSGGNTLWSCAFNNNIPAGNPDWESQMAEGKFNFAQPGIVDIFDKVKLLADKGYMQDGAVNAVWQDSIDAFNQKKAAMFIGGSWFATSIDGVADFKVGAFVPPYNKAGASNYVAIAPETGWGGSGKTAHKDEVIALLTHYMDGGRNILQNARGSIPVTKNTEGSVLPPVVDAVLPSVMGSPNAGSLYFVYLPTVFQVDLHKIMQDVVTGVLSPSEAASEMQPIYDGSFS